jgi:acyl-CoA dehydrogenase
MNLTEAQAGSDVGAIRSRAEPNGDGTYAVSGQKIYISWGDNDFTDNTVHLVLARLPDAPKGTKGISLFLVPKRLPDADGNAGVANTLKVVSLEHKLGLHGSPTCVMQYDGATGWLVGEEHGGMAAMFTMMNNARLGVGVHALGAGEAAYQHALAYAQDRVQGRAPVADGTGTILDHADVRRMLTGMKADIFASRALSLDLAVSIDMATATGEADWTARAAFLTPIAKNFGAETGLSVADAGIQVHGGMGFIEETGAAQFARDVRVSAIYEGTTGIQGADLVGRKLSDGGAAAQALLDEAAETATAFGSDRLAEAVAAVREATETLVGMEINDRLAGSVPYARAFALTLGGHYHAKAAMADPDGPHARLAASFLARQLSAVPGLLAEAVQGGRDLYSLSPDDLAA